MMNEWIDVKKQAAGFARKGSSIKKELYDAANTIATNCAQQKGCFNCAFQVDGEYCTLNKAPYDWPVFNVPLWSEADIMMAKALQMMGYTEITCFRDGHGGRTVFVRKDADGELLIDSIPIMSFLNAEDDTLYSLEQIIMEGGCK